MNRNVIKGKVTPYRIGFGSSATGDTLEYRLLGVTAGAIVEIASYTSTDTFELGDGEYGVDFSISNAAVKFVQFRLQTAGYLAAVSVDVREDDNVLLLLIIKYIKNKKELKKTGAVWQLIIYDDNGIDEILNKELKDKGGSNITDIQAGALAKELASSV